VFGHLVWVWFGFGMSKYLFFLAFGHKNELQQAPTIIICICIGDYRNSSICPNAQISQIFDLAKLDALPYFLAKSGQIEK
jgi:hypothetical protein